MFHESQEMSFQGSDPPTCPLSTHTLKIAGFKTAMVVLGGGGGDDAATSVFIPWILVVRDDCNLLRPAVMICKHLQLDGQFGLWDWIGYCAFFVCCLANVNHKDCHFKIS